MMGTKKCFRKDMLKIRKCLPYTIVAFILMAFIAMAHAQDQVISKGVVKSIDLPNRTLVIQTIDRENVTIIIDDAALNKFEKGVIKVGYEVTVKCIIENNRLRSISFFVKPPG